jgi:hypothetical protein
METTAVQTPSTEVYVSQTGTTLIQAGSYQKSTTGGYNVTFPRMFSSPPVVVVTPFWNGQSAEVGSWETIDTISNQGFRGFSRNVASNYFVEWVAIGKS